MLGIDMGKRHEAVALLRQGLSPDQIALGQQVGLSTILQYLDQMVGAGEIRQSDILFSVRSDVRHAVLHLIKLDSSLIRAHWTIPTRLKASGIDSTAGDVEVVVRYRDEQIAFGDMYEDLRTVEMGIHRLVRSTLEEELGTNESGWWRAIPQTIRAKCAPGAKRTTIPACILTDIPISSTSAKSLKRTGK